ncbi:MAG: hypothetical protein HKN33_00685 [Pyrinomonadaceae bacterium]|nr:hypothetical protein [Pyrinomonadaceae bacterium]
MITIAESVMKTLSEKKGIKSLGKLREKFRESIENGYETAAKDCLTCEVQGSCCTDAHFVNVHISRLEAAAMLDAFNDLPADLRGRISDRVDRSVEELGSSFSDTYACPLFEKGIGCLVHKTAKPLPCINHACYGNESDLPPSELLESTESEISSLNNRVYRNDWNWLPIPLWLKRIARETREKTRKKELIDG